MRARALALTAAVCTIFCIAGPACAQQTMLVVPVATIYPGDTVRDALVRMEEFGGDQAGFVASKADIIGRIARRTLLAGHAIPQEAVEDPRAVLNGAPVLLVYRRPGLTITASGQALQSARVGDAIRVRNSESGIVVVGTVELDGTIKVAN